MTETQKLALLREALREIEALSNANSAVVLIAKTALARSFK